MSVNIIKAASIPYKTFNFTRQSGRYNSRGELFQANQPGLEPYAGGLAIWVEEGTTNRLVNALLVDGNSNNLADSWNTNVANALSCSGGVQTFLATGQWGGEML